MNLSVLLLVGINLHKISLQGIDENKQEAAMNEELVGVKSKKSRSSNVPAALETNLSEIGDKLEKAEDVIVCEVNN